jgi:putative ABC transport system permease protein
VALSPFGPLGLARNLEFDHPVRLNAPVLVATVVTVLFVFALTALLSSVDGSERHPAREGAPLVRFDEALRGVGPVAAAGASVRGRRSARAAVAATAIAVAAAIAAAGMVASYDRLTSRPEQFGAWWDLAVGQYSEQGPLDDGVAKLLANPAVAVAAGFADEPAVATIDGRRATFLGTVDYTGHHDPVIAEGRGPTADDEAALGRNTAKDLHKGIGDEVTIVSNDDQRFKLRVVGIAVVNDAVASDAGAAGRGVLVPWPVILKISGPATVAQSILVRLVPEGDREAAIESVRRDFPGSVREPAPQVDVRNIGRLRALPWLIAAVVGILALATLVHALITRLTRSRTTLAVLAALGFSRRQRRGVCLLASAMPVAAGIAVGLPLGLLVGGRVWRALADGIGLPSPAALAWTTAVVVSLATLGLAMLVALVVSRGTVRVTPSEQLRVE